MAACKILLCTLLLVVATQSEDKWVWNGKTAKAVRTDGRVRYGVYDPEGLDEFYRPELRPPPRDLPPLIRPSPPSNHPPPYRPYPPPSQKPEADPTSFEKCKCVHSFNCKSPGLVFGSCDTGKKYCCEKSVKGVRKDFEPDNEYPEVLAGPGGPVDHLDKPYGRPDRPQGRPDRPLGRPDRPTGLGSFAERPLVTGGYGQLPDGSLGLGGGQRRPYAQGPRY